MANLKRAIAGIAAAAALFATLVGVPAQAAEVKSSATDPANVVQALKYIQELNELRAKQNPSFTQQQIADVWNADYEPSTPYTANQFDPVMSDGKPRPALKVNDEMMKWAQARADEQAKLGYIDFHAGTWNGSPTWAKSSKYGDNFASFLDNPAYKSDTYYVGPENLASSDRPNDPIQMWNSEVTYSGTNPKVGRQGYGHYLTNLQHLANLVGIGVAQSSNGKWIYVLELAYSPTQPSKTVDEALAEYIKPQSADPVTASAVEGMEPSLPSEVTVHYTDGSQKQMPVTWNSYDWASTQAGQSVKVDGTVTGTSVTTTATVSITKATATSVDNPADITTKSGVAPQLPENAVVHYNNNQTKAQKVTWNPVDKADYSGRTGGEFTVSGTVEGLPVQIKVTVEPATVDSVDPLEDITVIKGQDFTAPTTANVNYSNGEKVAETVTWANLSDVKTDTVGDYTLNGTVAEKDVHLTVHVVAAKITAVTAPQGVTVESGTAEDALGLPQNVHATFDNGSEDDVAVKWPALDDTQKKTLTSRDGGTITLKGTVTGWDQPVEITVTVNPAKATSAAIANADKDVTTQSGTKPVLATQGEVKWSNGDVTKENVTWEKIDATQYSNRNGGEFDVKGTLHGFEVTTHVTVEPATITKVADIDPVSTEAKVAPTLPATVKVEWSNSETSEENVTWNISEADYAKRGSKTITGTILTGTAHETEVTTTLNVSAATLDSVDNPEPLTVASGTKEADLTLPATVVAHYSDGTTDNVNVTWDALNDDNKATLAATEEGSFTLAGRAEGKDVQLTVNVTPATIVAVDAPEPITVASGTAEADLNLPTEVTVHWSNGSETKAGVAWSALTDADKETLASVKGGSFTLTGDVAGYTKPQARTLMRLMAAATGDKDVTLTVNVTPATAQSVAPLDTVSTPSGTAPQLPEKATVTWSGKQTTEEPITWDTDKVTKDLYSTRTASSFEVAGTAAGLPVTVTVNVEAATVLSVTPEKDSAETFVNTPVQLPRANVAWSNGDTETADVSWDPISEEQLSTAGEFMLKGTASVSGQAYGISVKVIVKAKEEPAPEPTPGTDEQPKGDTQQGDQQGAKPAHGSKDAAHSSKGKLPLTGAHTGVISLSAIALIGAGAVLAARPRRRTH